MEKSKCSGCNKILNLNVFIENKKQYKTCLKCRTKTRNYQNLNRKQTRIDSEKYRNKNLDKISRLKKIQYEKNRNIILEQQKQFRKKNPELFLFKRAKQNAKSKCLDFNINLDFIYEIYPKNNICPLLNKPMIIGTPYAPSIDRIDSTKGYVKENVQIISWKANTIKNDSTYFELLKVYKYFSKYTSQEEVFKFYNCCEPIQNYTAYLKQKLNRKKSYCKKIGITFGINEENIKIPKICPVLNMELSIDNKEKKNNSPSLDRIIPELGYIPGNVMVISMKANRIKSNATLSEMGLIVSNSRGKND